jgi:hypothetical protein
MRTRQPNKPVAESYSLQNKGYKDDNDAHRREVKEAELMSASSPVRLDRAAVLPQARGSTVLAF